MPGNPDLDSSLDDLEPDKNRCCMAVMAGRASLIASMTLGFTSTSTWRIGRGRLNRHTCSPNPQDASPAKSWKYILEKRNVYI